MLEENFDVQVDRVMFVDEGVQALGRRKYDLVLVNRLIFEDGSDGLELVRRMKQGQVAPDTPIMLISNFADAQQRAVDCGAAPGFGKAALFDPQTIARLAEFLPARRSTSADSAGRAGAEGRR